MIDLINPANNKKLTEKGDGFIDESGSFFPKIHGALRLTSVENYTKNFGFEWNTFRQTQIDSHIQSDVSRERFFTETAWDRQELAGQDILEVGCGAGRFSQVVLEETEAILYSVDYSDAVTANYENNKQATNRFFLFQASIYEMPFPDNSFDKVFCFGVLQHTPDFKQSVKALIDKAKPGGEIVVDFYPIRGWWTKIHSKYILRPFTKRMNHEKLLKLITRNIGWLMKTYFFFDKMKVGKLFNRFLPICDIKGTFPSHLTPEQLREWAILDTFDMFSPEHDHPQRIETVAKWFREFGAEVTFSGFVEFGESKVQAPVIRAIKK
jgi:SAM-dependent methyltransferase